MADLLVTDVRVPDGFSPLERIVLSANGNLQRIMSAYYNTPVLLKVLKNEPIDSRPGERLFERQVEETCRGVIWCRASSVITFSNDEYADIFASGKVGVGQLFSLLRIQPEFSLTDAQRTDDTFWRKYTLEAPGIHCSITEVFPLNLFSLF